MIKKILIFNHDDYNQFISTLVEGLKTFKDIELFSTSKINYSSDIVIKSKRVYEVGHNLEGADLLKFFPLTPWRVADGGAANPIIFSKVADEDEYIEECEDLMEECDLIIIVDVGHKYPTAWFKNQEGQSMNYVHNFDSYITHLHEYAIANHKDKIAFLDTISTYFIDNEYTMYGKYVGGSPAYCKVYFKREKSLDLEWFDNVVPFPRAAEERYFTGGKNFNKIWNNKDLDIAALFRIGGNNSRKIIKDTLIKHYGDNEKCNFVNVFDFGDARNREIDNKLYGFNKDELGKGTWHHHSYFETILRSKVSVECPQFQGWGFYTYRMWESLANGCCYFYPSPTYNVDFPNGLIDGEDFIIYNDSDDLIEKMEYYWLHEDEMITIAENGFNKLVKYHTSEVRAKEFLETCERYME